MMFTLKKIILFPISLFVVFLALMAKWLLTLSSYVVAPLMLYIFGCGIYTAYRQTWDQFFILLFPLPVDTVQRDDDDDVDQRQKCEDR